MAVPPPPSADRTPVAFVVWGSLGDLHPFIALGLELKARGVPVIVASHAEYRPKVEAEGLGFRPIRPSFADLEAAFGTDRAGITRLLLRHPLWLLTRAILPFLEATIEDTRALLDETPWLVTATAAIGARLAAEAQGAAWLAAVLQPMQFLSRRDPPVFMPGEWLAPAVRALGPSAADALHALVRWRLARLCRPVHEARRRLGLAPVPGDPLFTGQFGAAGTLALYSPLLGAAQPDYPPGVEITGYAFYDSEHGGGTDLPPSLADFLRAGEAPVVFTLGSAFVHAPGDFYRVGAAAARRLGQRAVLLVGDDGLAAHGGFGSAAVHVAGYAAYSALFPQARAVVHQGGVGTLGQALRAGRPQLVVPHFADQADNAARVVRLGLAATLGRRAFTVDRLTRRLGALLASPRAAAVAASVGRQVGEERGAARAAEAILRWRRDAARTHERSHVENSH